MCHKKRIANYDNFEWTKMECSQWKVETKEDEKVWQQGTSLITIPTKKLSSNVKRTTQRKDTFQGGEPDRILKLLPSIF